MQSSMRWWKSWKCCDQRWQRVERQRELDEFNWLLWRSTLRRTKHRRHQFRFVEEIPLLEWHINLSIFLRFIHLVVSSSGVDSERYDSNDDVANCSSSMGDESTSDGAGWRTNDHPSQHDIQSTIDTIINNKSSKRIYKAVAKEWGITCKMSETCRCMDCQSNYFDCEYDEVCTRQIIHFGWTRRVYSLTFPFTERAKQDRWWSGCGRSNVYQWSDARIGLHNHLRLECANRITFFVVFTYEKTCIMTSIHIPLGGSGIDARSTD